MTTSLPKHLAISLALSAAFSLSGCGLISDPPTQLEAKLYLAGDDIDDRGDVAEAIMAQMGIKELKEDNVRVVKDGKRGYFFRIVGKEALPPALLKQVSAGLARVNQINAWQGKLMVSQDPGLDDFLKTSERNFAFQAGWHNAEVDAYLIQKNPLFASLIAPAGTGAEQKHTVSCMLSFTPFPALPELKGKMSEVMPGMGAMAALDRSGIYAREMTVPHQITLVQPDLMKLETPLVQDGKVLFQFTQIEDAKVTVIGGGTTGKPITIDHGAVELCKGKLAEMLPAAKTMIDQAAPLAEIRTIGKATLVAMPKPS